MLLTVVNIVLCFFFRNESKKDGYIKMAQPYNFLPVPST